VAIETSDTSKQKCATDLLGVLHFFKFTQQTYTHTTAFKKINILN